MKEITYTFPKAEDAKYSGSFTVKVQKRAERCALQREAMLSSEGIKEDPTKYFEFSEKIIAERIVKLDVIHIESGETITELEQLEYLQCEDLISAIVQTVIGGKKLGKQTA